jgi:CPA2 family monovalent cation:H+ antiporter-2
VLLRAAGALAECAELPAAEPHVAGGDGDGLARPLPARSHVVIIGYGFNGKNLARVLHETSVPYVVVEFDAEAVRAAAAEGHPVVYGDGARPVVLEHVHIGTAVVVVVAIDDPVAARRIVKLVRTANPHAALVVRTRKLTEIDELYAMGVDEVVPEEMETSVELFARVLRCLDVPANVVAAQVDVVRSEHYTMMRGGEPSAQRIERIYDLFTAATTVTHMLRAESPAIGATVGSLALRAHVGATLIAVVRKDAATTNPPDDYELAQGDILVILGNHAQLAAARTLLEPQREQAFT